MAVNIPMNQSGMTSTVSYAQSLRAIGQALELLHVQSFDMENKGNDYLVWNRTRPDQAEEPPHVDSGESSAKPVSRRIGIASEEEKGEPTSPVETQPLRYTPDDITRLDAEGRAKRGNTQQVPDAYRLSQLLRAVGGYVQHLSARLLGICWRDQWVAVVYEKEGRRELEVLRPDSIYDFWVRMHLRRESVVH